MWSWDAWRGPAKGRAGVGRARWIRRSPGEVLGCVAVPATCGGPRARGRWRLGEVQPKGARALRGQVGYPRGQALSWRASLCLGHTGMPAVKKQGWSYGATTGAGAPSVQRQGELVLGRADHCAHCAPDVSRQGIVRAHPDLSQGPADLQSAALTTELCTHVRAELRARAAIFSGLCRACPPRQALCSGGVS